MLNITEVRVKLIPEQSDKLLAFASVTIDDALVIRDIKVIEGGERKAMLEELRKELRSCKCSSRCCVLRQLRSYNTGSYS